MNHRVVRLLFSCSSSGITAFPPRWRSPSSAILASAPPPHRYIAYRTCPTVLLAHRSSFLRIRCAGGIAPLFGTLTNMDCQHSRVMHSY